MFKLVLKYSNIGVVSQYVFNINAKLITKNPWSWHWSSTLDADTNQQSRCIIYFLFLGCCRCIRWSTLGFLFILQVVYGYDKIIVFFTLVLLCKLFEGFFESGVYTHTHRDTGDYLHTVRTVCTWSWAPHGESKTMKHGGPLNVTSWGWGVIHPSGPHRRIFEKKVLYNMTVSFVGPRCKC